MAASFGSMPSPPQSTSKPSICLSNRFALLASDGDLSGDYTAPASNHPARPQRCHAKPLDERSSDVPVEGSDIEEEKTLTSGDLWWVRPWHQGRCTDLDPLELLRLRHEEAAARAGGVPWQERGPYVEPGKGGGVFWRGQRHRPGLYGGKVRFANRGGKNKEKYQKLAREGKLKPVWAPGWNTASTSCSSRPAAEPRVVPPPGRG